ncbi:MAG: uracil-DNA glycosylase, partial [Agathobaculum sp.]
MVHLDNDWDDILAGEFSQEYYKRIRYWLKKEYAEQTIYPPMHDIFNALRYTPYAAVKAVILGQDPYHGPGQAHGLCFSVQPGVQPPPSLQNIFKELHSDLGIDPPQNGTLTHWAQQGVLLLNTTLTVRQGCANSHKNLGWTTFTDHVIDKLNDRDRPIVFLL